MREILTFGLMGVIACSFSVRAVAGNFFTDFNSGLPEHTTVQGTANVDDKGGVDGSGVLKLTVAQAGQIGSFLIDPLDGKAHVASFVARFKAYIGGGTSADGFAFHFGSKFSPTPFADLPGPLMVVFDTYKNGAQKTPGIRVQAGKEVKAEDYVPLRQEKFVDVMVKMDPDGTVDVTYDNELICTNIYVRATNIVGGFAFGARTGSRTDNHFIDDLKIATQTSPRAYVETFLPTGNNVSPSVNVDLLIRELKTKVKRASVKLKWDGEWVEPETSSEKEGVSVHFAPTEIYQPESSHTVTLEFMDTGKPTVTNQFSYSFRISSQILLSK